MRYAHNRMRAPSESQRTAARVNIDVRLSRVIAAMERNPEANLMLETLASIAGISYGHLTRLFRAELGFSPAQYYRNLRLNWAKQLLTQTRMSVTEITFACGFTSLPAFSRAFSAAYNMSPRAARAKDLATGRSALSV